MDQYKEEFTKDVLAGLTVKQLQEKYNRTRSTIYKWKSQWGLTGKSPNSQQRILDRSLETGTKICSICGETKSLTEFYSNGYSPNGKQKFKGKCKPCEEQSRYATRTSIIKEVLEELGKKYECERCGYKKNSAALCFHHTDPNQKDFNIAEISKTVKANIKEEIRKCELLCHNCHMEEHYPHRMIVDED